MLRLKHLSKDNEDGALPMQYDFGGYMDCPSEGEASPIDSVGATRKLMEQVARESVAAVGNISVRSGAFATGLSMSESGSAVKGVLQPDLSVIYRSVSVIDRHMHIHGQRSVDYRPVSLSVMLTWMHHQQESCVCMCSKPMSMLPWWSCDSLNALLVKILSKDQPMYLVGVSQYVRLSPY